MEQTEHMYIKTNGIRLHVVEQGPEDGNCLILLHGFPEFWYSWHDYIPYFANKGYRVWAPDQRGYNLSEKPRRLKDYELSQLVSDIVGLIKASQKEKVILVGHDWGGIVAWHVARLHPSLVQKLVIINSPHEGALLDHIRQKPSQLFRSAYIFFFQFRSLLVPLLRLFKWRPFTKTMQLSSKKGTFTDEDLRHYIAAWSKPNAMKAMLKWYRANGRQFTTIQKPSRVVVPTLVIWGMKDQFLDSELASKSLRYCDNGKGILIGEGAHWVHLEHPERIRKLINAFISQ